MDSIYENDGVRIYHSDIIAIDKYVHNMHDKSLLRYNCIEI